MIVQQILTSKGNDNVVTVSPDLSITEVAKILTQNRIGGVVVSSGGDTAEGILSERDIVRALANRGPDIMQENANALMTRDPTCCQRRDTADQVLRKMTDGRFRHMPVVEDGKLIGIVTIGDVVKARLNELSMERDALEGMIAGH
ncbi:CBS domain-containing protein [Pseudooceanicola sp.]|uniref:CBS domain-containing protein n=1 Tax=Pseudooceanicola sp. TaxID=1914328 RepID=UPI000C0B22C7|nr:histidine kinase [Pseudooceanicola sp.]|tara:strand:- start:11432 stop:11866 length:435 start_codon:yes stop_codon:yes gene_type:complete